MCPPNCPRTLQEYGDCSKYPGCELGSCCFELPAMCGEECPAVVQKYGNCDKLYPTCNGSCCFELPHEKCGEECPAVVQMMGGCAKYPTCELGVCCFEVNYKGKLDNRSSNLVFISGKCSEEYPDLKPGEECIEYPPRNCEPPKTVLNKGECANYPGCPLDVCCFEEKICDSKICPEEIVPIGTCKTDYPYCTTPGCCVECSRECYLPGTVKEMMIGDKKCCPESCPPLPCDKLCTDGPY